MSVHAKCTPRFAALLAVLFTLTACGMSPEEQLVAARDQVESKDYSTAIITLRNLLRENPDSMEGRLLLAETTVALGDPLTAEKELSRAFELGANDPRYLQMYYDVKLATGDAAVVIDRLAESDGREGLASDVVSRLRGEALLNLGSAIDAEEAYRLALGANPANVDARRGLAATLLALGEKEAGRAELTRLTTDFPDHAEGWNLSGQAYLRDADFEPAADAFKAALDAVASSPNRLAELQALAGLADAQLSSNNQDGADQTIRRLGSIAGGSPQTRFLRARLEASRENYDLAASELESVLSATPDNVSVLFLYGSVQLARGEYITAADVLSRVVTRSPENLIARRLLAQAQIESSEPAAAVETLTPLLEAEDVDVGTAQFASAAMIRSGSVTEAIRLLEQALSNNSDDVDLKLSLAAAYLQAGRGSEALALAESVPDDADSYRKDLLLALGFAATNRTDEADDKIRELMTRFSDDSQALILGADYFLRKQDSETAKQYYDEVIAIDPVNTNARLGLARIAGANGDLASAKSQFEAILNENPGNLVALAAMANFAADDGDNERAEELLIRASAANESAALPRMMLARLYLRNGNALRAEQSSQEAARLSPEDPAIQLATAGVLTGLSKTREALPYLQKATELAPNSETAWFSLAQTRLALGNNAEARSALERLLLVEPDSMRGLIVMALLELADGSESNARGIVANLKSKYPDRAAPYSLEADINMNVGAYEDAAKLYREAFALEPSSALARRSYQAASRAGLNDAGSLLQQWVDDNPDDNTAAVFLAQYTFQSGDTQESIRLYEKALEETPDNFAVLNNLAWAYLKQGDTRAEATARRAYDLRPDIASIADTLGWVLVQNGKVEEGTRLIEDAYEKKPESGNIVFHLAYVRKLAGNSSESIRLLERLLNDDEDFDERPNAEALLNELTS